MTVGPLNSKKAYRTIGLPKFLIEELTDHIERFPSESDWIFSHSAGSHLDYKRFLRRYWRPAVEAVAMLIAEGQSPRYIADRLGHTSTRTVLDVFGHLYDDADETAMEGLELLRKKAVTDSRRTVDEQQVISIDHLHRKKGT
jgi:integrase